MNNLRIVFMGTPDFAVPSLKILATNGFNVVGVVTAPDRPKGRGRKMAHSAVKDCALELGIPVLQPTNLKSDSFIEELRALKANLQVVVAFRMLPEVVWSMPELGTFNLHASLLPQYRGAAPINWAIINGETTTGVTTFFLKHAIDTGAIIFQEKEEILPSDDVSTLYSRLMEKGAGLVMKTVKAIRDDAVTPHPQVEIGHLQEAPKIFKETCKIDWTRSVGELVNFVRGLSPYPAAWTYLNGKHFKIFKVQPSKDIPLKIEEIHAEDGRLWIGTGTGPLEILEFQQEGKKRMLVSDYLKGNTI